MPGLLKELARPSKPSIIVIPDLVSHCTFDLRVNPNVERAVVTSKAWLIREGNFRAKARRKLHGLKAGELTSMCYPDADYAKLRVCCDFMNYLFHLDNISDCMDNRGTAGTADTVLTALYHPKRFYTTARVDHMTRDFWKRLIRTATPGTQQRFIETFDFFFQAISVQAVDREDGNIPDLESYIAVRRDTSGCKPCWALIEYANDLDIPDEVMEHDVLRNLGEAANDLVTWSNDIFSYNVEQSKGDTHNMIVVVMHEQGLELQEAVDFVGDMCKQSIDRFIENTALLPSWGERIDKDVAVYVRGLQDWIVGSLHWSFDTERYFGKAGREVKKNRKVTLLPLRK